jgi:parvulin-like peptidyl-prolyl isomerase
MFGTMKQWFARPRLRRVGMIAVGLTALSVGAWFGRGLVARQPGKPTTTPQAAASIEPTASSAPSDYTSRVVAYVHGTQPITRQDLGEYLIARMGHEKLPLLLNKRLVDDACQQRGIHVTAAEVEAAFAEDLKGIATDKDTFVKTVLTRYKKNLYEWKEDVLRPRLQMTRLAQPRISVSHEELRQAFESTYGEKVECRLIMWPLSKEKEVLEQYGTLRSSEQAFDKAAREQETSWLAASAGKIKPIGRWTMDKDMEKEAFRLQPGQVSIPVKTPQGITLLKCDKRIPADTAVSFESVKDKLDKELREKHLQVEMGRFFQALKDKARPQTVLQKSDRAVPGPTPLSSQVVAYLNGARPVTREELGEFLIARYGAEKLEFLVNRRIIDHECKQRGIVVTDEELEKTFEADLKAMQTDKKQFEREFLTKFGKTMYEWREDVLRARLMLMRLSEGRAKVTDVDLKKGFEAYHGERLECRVILWPPEQAKFAMTEYTRLRDSEEEFARKAKNQPSSNLAASGGKLPVFGRNCLGDENLEREAFKLREGEVTALIGTPQGQVMLKCDKRIPPDTAVKLDQVRDKLTKEIMDKKVQQEMQVVFKDLRDKAKPQLILKTTGKPEDILAESRRITSDLPPLGTGPLK